MVEKEELVKRILHRGENSGRSDDTNLDIINKRIDADTRSVKWMLAERNLPNYKLLLTQFSFSSNR